MPFSGRFSSAQCSANGRRPWRLCSGDPSHALRSALMEGTQSPPSGPGWAGHLETVTGRGRRAGSKAVRGLRSEKLQEPWGPRRPRPPWVSQGALNSSRNGAGLPGAAAEIAERG